MRPGGLTDPEGDFFKTLPDAIRHSVGDRRAARGYDVHIDNVCADIMFEVVQKGVIMVTLGDHTLRLVTEVNGPKMIPDMAREKGDFDSRLKEAVDRVMNGEHMIAETVSQYTACDQEQMRRENESDCSEGDVPIGAWNLRKLGIAVEGENPGFISISQQEAFDQRVKFIKDMVEIISKQVDTIAKRNSFEPTIQVKIEYGILSIFYSKRIICRVP